MDYREANNRVVQLVNEALDAGLQGKERPDPLGAGADHCTDDLIGPTDEVRPHLSYSFPYSALEVDGPSFAENATATWREKGLDITVLDAPHFFQRTAVSEDGFRLSVTVNEDIDQISIGGSGPCVDPPD